MALEFSCQDMMILEQFDLLGPAAYILLELIDHFVYND